MKLRYFAILRPLKKEVDVMLDIHGLQVMMHVCPWYFHFTYEIYYLKLINKGIYELKCENESKYGCTLEGLIWK